MDREHILSKEETEFILKSIACLMAHETIPEVVTMAFKLGYQLDIATRIVLVSSNQQLQDADIDEDCR